MTLEKFGFIVIIILTLYFLSKPPVNSEFTCNPSGKAGITCQ